MSIGPSRVVEPYSIKNLPPLIVGGAVFNTQYIDDPFSVPTTAILQYAFDHGLNALDTSPYYGPSEEIIGKSLKNVTYLRDKYYICTKAGRIRLNEFDYSPKLVRQSVFRLCERLNTTYLDLVYMHDIEFVSVPEIIEALKELKRLKTEGIVRNIGVSGYPVELLYYVAKKCAEDAEIGSLDAVMSYSHGCLQNTKLFDFYRGLLEECGVKKVMNGSILSMSLLRSGSTMDFHPGDAKLKQRVSQVAQGLLKSRIEMADLATRFAIKRWLFDTREQDEGAKELEWNPETSIVLGVNTLEQLKAAIDAYWAVKQDQNNEGDELLYKKVQKEFGEHMNEEWESGIEHEEIK